MRKMSDERTIHDIRKARGRLTLSSIGDATSGSGRRSTNIIEALEAVL